MKETLWRQKSREIWLRDRDKNTKSSHTTANVCGRRNLSVEVKVNGEWLNADVDIKEEASRLFKLSCLNQGIGNPLVR